MLIPGPARRREGYQPDTARPTSAVTSWLAMDEQDVLRPGKHHQRGFPLSIIAEVGNNHQGSVDFAKDWWTVGPARTL